MNKQKEKQIYQVTNNNKDNFENLNTSQLSNLSSNNNKDLDDKSFLTDISSINGSYYTDFLNTKIKLDNSEMQNVTNIFNMKDKTYFTNKRILPNLVNNNTQINITNNITLINDKSFVNQSKEINYSMSKLLKQDLNESNFENSEDIQIFGQIYSDTINVSKIFQNRVKFNNGLLKQLAESNISECLSLIKNCRENTVIKDFLECWFSRKDIKKFKYNYFHTFVFLNLSLKLWLTNHLTYHEIALLVLNKILSYLFNFLTSEFSKIGFSNDIDRSFFGENNTNPLYEGLDNLKLDDKITCSRIDKINFVVKLYENLHKDKRLKAYVESNEEKHCKVS
jgi:hypothetical protein